MNDRTALRTVKLVHTIAWLFFVACILGAPVAAYHGRFTLAAALIGCVAVEAIILLLNRWACPLTAVAARYTDDRRPNFDIYLPQWLALHNKTIFTVLYLVGVVYVALAWWRQGLVS